jgi:cold shock CspA family protein
MTSNIGKIFDKFLSETPKGDDVITPDDKRVEGKIIHISDAGWGFISSLDIKFTRIFFHWTYLKQDTKKFTELKKGMRVKFTPIEVAGAGYRAIKIEVLE